jgi:AP-2 complex subunit alpha
MPVFPERESTLVNRLHAKGEKSQDKRTWIIGGREENRERENERFKTFRKTTAESAAIAESAANARAAVAANRAGAAAAIANANGGERRRAEAPTRQGTLVDDMMGASRGGTEDIMASLADLDLSGQTVQDEPLLPETRQRSVSDVSATDSAAGVVTGATNGDSGPNVQTATLGGVNPAMLAPLTVGPNIEKASQIYRYLVVLCSLL